MIASALNKLLSFSTQSNFFVLGNSHWSATVILDSRWRSKKSSFLEQTIVIYIYSKATGNANRLDQLHTDKPVIHRQKDWLLIHGPCHSTTLHSCNTMDRDNPQNSDCTYRNRYVFETRMMFWMRWSIQTGRAERINIKRVWGKLKRGVFEFMLHEQWSNTWWLYLSAASTYLRAVV